jgi:transposase
MEIFGAVEPETGDFFYNIVPKEKRSKKKMGRPKKGEVADSMKPKVKEKGRKSRQMNDFMQKLCDKYPNDLILLICDNAWWHRSKYTVIPKRLTIAFIPKYTPEMNPIEQLWREVRTQGFHNRYFKDLAGVESNLHTTINHLKPEIIMSITQRDWIMKCIKLAKT